MPNDTPDLRESHFEVLLKVCDLAGIDMPEFWELCRSSAFHQGASNAALDPTATPCPEYVIYEYIYSAVRSQFVAWVAGEIGGIYTHCGTAEPAFTNVGIFTWMRHDQTRLYSVMCSLTPSGNEHKWSANFLDPSKHLSKVGEASSLEDAVELIVQTENDLLGVSSEDVRRIVDASQHSFSEDGMSEDGYRMIFNAGVRRHGRVPTPEELTAIWG